LCKAHRILYKEKEINSTAWRAREKKVKQRLGNVLKRETGRVKER
jgi:hypothetical protein